MFVNSFFCCSVLGAFFFYLIIDTIFTEENSDNKGRLSDTAVMLLLSIPFLFIFLIGCHCMYLTNMIYDEVKEREKEKR